MSAGLRKKRHRAAGFTLIEMVAVIVVLGIVTAGFIDFLGLGTKVYVDAVGREQVVSQTRYMMERATREVREALPNSVRVATVGNVQCIEFVPISASSTYINIAVAPEAPNSSVKLVMHDVAGIDADKIVVYPLSSFDVYGSDPATATTGNIFKLAAVPGNGSAAQTVNLLNSVRFDADSPTGRYFLVKNAVAYCADSNSGTIRRYGNYWPPLAGQQVPPQNATGVLMAENLKSGSAPFDYASATLVTNAVVQMTFDVVRNGEEVNFHHEVHLINVP